MADFSESDGNSEILNCYNVAARCRLCRFSFERGDTVIVDIDDKRSKPQRYTSLFRCATDDSAGALITFGRDCDECQEDSCPAHGYHEACLDIWGRDPPPNRFPGLPDATTYTFTPSAFDDRRRLDRIRLSLIDKLVTMLPTAEFPPEIWTMIVSRDLVQMCAVNNMRELWDRRNTCDAELDFTQSIWAHYMCIEGVRYVERLTNEPPGTNAACDGITAAVQLLDGNKVSSCTVVRVLEDYLGVRQLVFTPPDCDLSAQTATSYDTGLVDERKNTWWRTVHLRPDTKLQALTDGLKIRSIKTIDVIEDQSAPTSKHMVWRVPMTPSRIEALPVLRYTPKVYRDEEWGDWHMTSITCNSPDVTGYSAFWRMNLITLHAHQRDEKDMSFYGHYDEYYEGRGIWVYFPIAKCERFVQVFCRRGNQNNHMGIIFRTNRGREMVLGPGLPISGPGSVDNGQLAFRHICSIPADTPTRIHFNVSPYGIQRLIFEEPTSNFHPPIRPSRLLQSPNFASIGTYSVSTVALDGVAHATPSYKKHMLLSGCTVMCGLLFTYADKNRPSATLGEFRLDDIGQPIDLSASETVYLGFLCNGKASALTQVLTSPRENSRTMTWFRFPLKGYIELWYTGLNCYIYHSETGPADRKGQGNITAASGEQ